LRYEMEESKGKVFLVTSLKPKEGKTFITICMAFTLAMIKKRVLIIDTNFRHNSLTQALVKKEAAPKKITQKSNAADDEQELLMEDYSNTFVSSSVVSTTNQLIHVMGNTGCAASPAEIFAGKNFGHTIGLLRQQYDYILIEGAALNNFSDTRELTDYADKVIPVFSTESEIRSQDRESIRFLKSLNGKLMGAVLNKTNIKDIDAE
jgi:succinoglycan biosynthesis transport protein ExoP